MPATPFLSPLTNRREDDWGGENRSANDRSHRAAMTESS